MTALPATRLFCATDIATGTISRPRRRRRSRWAWVIETALTAIGVTLAGFTASYGLAS